MSSSSPSTLVYRRSGKGARKVTEAILTALGGAGTVVKYGQPTPDQRFDHGIFVGCFNEAVAVDCERITAFVEDSQDAMRVLGIFPRARLTLMSLRRVSECISMAAYLSEVEEVTEVLTEALKELTVGPPTTALPSTLAEVPATLAERPRGPWILPPYERSQGSTSVALEKGDWGLDVQVRDLYVASGREVAVMWRSTGSSWEVHAYSETLDCLKAFSKFNPQGTPRQIKLTTTNHPQSLFVEA